MWTNPTAEVPPAQAPPKSGGLNVRIVWNTVRRHTLALLGVAILAGGVGAAIWLFLPLPNKTAAVVFHISPQERSLIARPGGGERRDLDAYRQSQVNLIKNRRTLADALNDDQVRNLKILKEAKPDPVTWLEGKVSVDARGGAEYMRITLEGDDEEELRTLIGAVSRAYQTAAGVREHGARQSLLEKLNKEVKETQALVDAAYAEIDRIVLALGSTDPAILEGFLTRKERELHDALADHKRAQEQRAQVEAAVKAIKYRAPNEIVAILGTVWVGTLPRVEVPEALVQERLAQDPEYRRRQLVVTLAKEELDRVEKGLDEKINPEAFAKARMAVKVAEDQLKKYKDDVVEQMEAARRALLGLDDDARVEAAEKALKKATEQEKDAWSKVGAIEDKIKLFNSQKLDLERLRRQNLQKENVVQELMRNIELLRIDLKSEPRITLWEDPFILPAFEGSRRMKFTAMASIATFGLGFVGLVFLEYRSRRVTHTDEVTAQLGTRLIGTIPPLSPSAREPGAAQTDLIEAIDTTRIMLVHGAQPDGDARVILVTSAVSGEGKTTLSGNLAISLTRAGFRTLLVDGDTRAPTAHDLFNLTETPGLGELLREEADVRDAVRSSPIPGLSILPAGKWTAATHQMLVGNRWRNLKRELKEDFDFIVVDTSPLLLVSDTLLMAREADGVVLSVLMGVSQISRVAETVNRLQAVGAKLSGVVVNNVRSSAAQHADAYRAKYYSQHSAALLPEAGLLEQTPDQAVVAEQETTGQTKNG